MASRVMLADNTPITDEQIQTLLDQCGFLWGQPKIDGMRVHINDAALPASRSGKIFKHKYLKAFCQEHPSLRGLDGEVTPGHEYSPTSFREAMSSIRSEEGPPDFTYWLFDDTALAEHVYDARHHRLEKVVMDFGHMIESAVGGYRAKLVVTPTLRLNSLEDIQLYEMAQLADGWEGIMLRRPDAAYKFGRSTNRGGELVKLKRFEDAEAIVVGYEAWQQNNNPSTIDIRGYSVKSHHQENKVDTEMLGVLKCELLSDRSVAFGVGVMRGVTHTERARLWAIRDTLPGRIFKFKHQGYGGGYDKPRAPVFLNWRIGTEF